jgi:hypothetical protein
VRSVYARRRPQTGDVTIVVIEMGKRCATARTAAVARSDWAAATFLVISVYNSSSSGHRAVTRSETPSFVRPWNARSTALPFLISAIQNRR